MIADGIHYESNGSGPPVICLHGIGGDAQGFALQLEGLGDTMRVISWSMPGYSGSAPLDNQSFGTLAKAVLRLADALGHEKVHLIGNSIGGMIALETAIAAPERVKTLALIGTTPAFGGRDDSFKDQFLAARLAPLDQGVSMGELAREFVPEIIGPRADEAAIPAAIASMEKVPEATYRAIMQTLVTFNRRDDLHRITQPCCLLAGEVDINAPLKTMARMADKLANVEFHTLPGIGHLAQLEAPEAVNDILRQFYARHA